MGNLVHIFVLFWKNMKLQIRRPWLTALELLILMGLMLLLVLLRLKAPIDKGVIETSFESYSIDALPVELYNTSKGILVYYTPQSTFLDQTMALVSSYLNITARGFNSEEELVENYTNTASQVIAGVIFNSDFGRATLSSGPIEYTIMPESIPGISWNLSLSLPSFPLFELTDKSTYGSYYMNYGFLVIQHAVSKTLLMKLLNTFGESFDDKFTIEMCRLPYPAYESDSFYKLPEYYIALAIILAFMFPSAMIAKDLVHEKQTKLKQTLIMMGISNWENWIAWFIKDIIYFLLCSVIMTIMLCASWDGPAVINKSNPTLIFLWLILYSCNVIVFTFFVTTFFHKENSAVAALCILYMITFVPYLLSRGLFHQIPIIARLLLCILPNTLFAYSVTVVQRLELLSGKGLEWSSIYDDKLINLEISMHLVYVMLIINIIIYVVLTWYIEVMRPGPFQKHHPWYFPFTATYWTSKKDIPPHTPYKYRFINPDFFEKDPPRIRPMINIKNLSKVYDRYSKPLIDRIDLRAYKGQITVLLGRNCCGKTTFVSMMCGAIDPTAGSIIMKEYNMCKADEARKILPFLGICPDYDVSIHQLSIKENLYFFCRLKGYETSSIKPEIGHILALLDLEIKKNRVVSTLSPSAGRRLSVGIALIGGSEVVILDEPTLYMDSSSRRIVWDALELERKTRAIFITTSHIKEADALADRIAVLHDGKIKCCGSPMFLKKIYNAGYILTLTKERECNSALVKKVIFSQIPEAFYMGEIEDKLKFILPPDKCDSYHILFKELEEKDIKIKNMLILETTLDELYEKIADTTSVKKRDGAAKEVKSLKYFKENSTYHSFTRKRNQGFALFTQHIKTLYRKKLIFSKRNTFLTLTQIIVLPIILTFSNLVKIKEVVNGGTEKRFDLDGFGKTYIPYGIDPSSNLTIDLGDTYASLLLSTEAIHLVDLEQENYLLYVIREANKNLRFYKSKYIIGATFEDDFNTTLITAFYNAEAYHSAPTSLLFVYNAILAYYAKEKTFVFRVNSKPLPYKDKDQKLFSTNSNLSLSFFWAQDIIIGLSILMSSFVILVAIENSTNCKKQQFINGLNAFVYWFSSVIYDYVMYLISCVLLLLILSIFETECLYEIQEIGSLLLLFLLHGLSALLFIYCCTFSSRSAPISYISIFLYYLFGLFLLSIVYKFEADNKYYISEPLNIIFTVFMPSYCVARGIYNIHRNCMSNHICNNDIIQSMCSRKNTASFVILSCCLDRCEDTCLFWSPQHISLSISGIGIQVIALILQPFVFILILILLELGAIKNLKICIRERRMQYYSESNSSTDKDVLDEAKRILNPPLSQLVDENYYLIFKNVMKFCPRFAVGKLSFGLKRGECFGLIGVDKAGKSTVLEMISGSTPLSVGNIYIDGLNIMKYPHKILDKVGFSFGKYSQLTQLTVEETLTMYAQIRGIPENDIVYFVESLTGILDFYPHLLVKDCNDTEKRKLSVAIAIIGTPPLILLDEPTAEMEPAACMTTRETIKQAVDIGCTVLLTTQKMKECQALCNRIGILAKGKLTYVGDFDNLKMQYEEGFSLLMRIRKTRQQRRSRHTKQALTLKGNLEEIKGVIEDAYPLAILKIEYSTYLNYYLPQETLVWSKLFSLLEKMKAQEIISSYSLCKTNLDQIFSYKVAYSDHLKDKKIVDYLKLRKLAKF